MGYVEPELINEYFVCILHTRKFGEIKYFSENSTFIRNKNEFIIKYLINRIIKKFQFLIQLKMK